MTSPLNAFILIITPDMVLDIVKFTNIEGVRVKGDTWQPCDETEI